MPASSRRGVTARPPPEGAGQRGSSAGDDLDGDRRDDLGVESHDDVGGTELLERLVQLDLATVELNARLRAHRVGDVGRGHRAEELAALARARPKLDLRAHETRRELICRAAIALLARRAVAPHALGLSNDALRCLQREPARDQEVARVAIGDIEQVALATEVVHVLPQDDLHDDSSSSPASTSASADAAASVDAAASASTGAAVSSSTSPTSVSSVASGGGPPYPP